MRVNEFIHYRTRLSKCLGYRRRPIVRRMEVVCVRLPEVPLTVTVNVPWLELLLAVNVLLDVAGLWLKDAPTPLGRPEVARVTWPE